MIASIIFIVKIYNIYLALVLRLYSNCEDITAKIVLSIQKWYTYRIYTCNKR